MASHLVARIRNFDSLKMFGIAGSINDTQPYHHLILMGLDEAKDQIEDVRSRPYQIEDCLTLLTYCDDLILKPGF